MLEALKGYKFHGVMIGFIVMCLFDKVLGIHVQGFDPGDNWLFEIFGATGAMAIRDTVGTVLRNMGIGK